MGPGAVKLPLELSSGNGSFAKAIAGSTGIETSLTSSPAAGNAIYVYKAIPTITNVTLPSGVLGAGTKTIAKFTVASSGGTIAWKQIMLDINKAG